MRHFKRFVIAVLVGATCWFYVAETADARLGDRRRARKQARQGGGQIVSQPQGSGLIINQKGSIVGQAPAQMMQVQAPPCPVQQCTPGVDCPTTQVVAATTQVVAVAPEKAGECPLTALSAMRQKITGQLDELDNHLSELDKLERRAAERESFRIRASVRDLKAEQEVQAAETRNRIEDLQQSMSALQLYSRPVPDLAPAPPAE